MESSIEPEELLQHASWLQRLARALTTDDAAAEDLVQETLGVAITAHSPVRDVRAFLAGVLRRRSLEARRESSRRRRRELEHGQEQAVSAPAADAGAERIDTLRALLDELQALPPAQREALKMRFLDEKTPAQIALRTGVSPATVRSHVSRGLAMLRTRLDQRRSGRADWLGALLPFAATGGRAPTTPSRAIVPGPLDGFGKTLGLSSSTLLSGVTLMTSKALLTTILPLALLGLWIGWDRGGHAPIPAHASQPLPSEELRSNLADVHPSDGAQHRRAVESKIEAEMLDPRARTTSGSAPRQIDATLADDVPLAQFRDQRTGEAVPRLPVEVQSVKDRILEAHSSPLGLTALNSGGELLTTDAHGRLTSGDSPEAGAYILQVRDQRARPGVQPAAKLRVQIPTTAPLEIPLGPTFRLAAAVPPPCGWRALTATWITARSRGNRNFETQVRVHDEPWIRFSNEIAELTGDGPWRIQFSDDLGLNVAQAEVSRRIGIEPHPLTLLFDSFGAIEFVAPRRAGAPALIGAVKASHIEDDESVRGYLDLDRSGTESRTRLGQLRAGTYRWTCGDHSGEVPVLPGEVTTVTIEGLTLGETFDAVVRVDATAAQDKDLSQRMFRLADAKDPFRGFAQFPTRAGSSAPGMWELRLEGLPLGKWNVVAPAGFTELTYEPRRVLVAIDRMPETIVARPKAQPIMVQLEVVDRDTGAPIVSAEAAINAGDQSYSIHSADDRGIIEIHRSPPDQVSEALVRAPGYRMSGHWFEPRVDGVRLRVALQRGWGSVVRVVRTESLEALEGIEVTIDGTPRGTTDAKGLLWITGEGPPESGSLGAGAEEFALTKTPFQPGATPPFDPIIGYTFLVRRRAAGD